MRDSEDARCKILTSACKANLCTCSGQRRRGAGRDHQGQGRRQDEGVARRLHGAGQVWTVQRRCLDQEECRQEKEEEVWGEIRQGGGEEEIACDCQLHRKRDHKKCPI